MRRILILTLAMALGVQMHTNTATAKPVESMQSEARNDVRRIIMEEWAYEGFGQKEQLWAVYIACRESTLKPQVSSGSSDGVFQLHQRSWSKFASRMGYRWQDVKGDVLTNVKVAVAIYKRSGANPWKGGRKAPECAADKAAWQAA